VNDSSFIAWLSGVVRFGTRWMLDALQSASFMCGHSLRSGVARVAARASPVLGTRGTVFHMQRLVSATPSGLLCLDADGCVALHCAVSSFTCGHSLEDRRSSESEVQLHGQRLVSS